MKPRKISRNDSRCPGDTYVVCRLPKRKRNDGWYKDEINWNLPRDMDTVSNISNSSNYSNSSQQSNKSIQVNNDGTTTVTINPLKITNTIRKKPTETVTVSSETSPILSAFLTKVPEPELPKPEIYGGGQNVKLAA